MPTPKAQSGTFLRNTCTVAALLGVGLVTGAVLAESSLLNFRLADIPRLTPRAPYQEFSGNPTQAAYPGQLRHHQPQPHHLAASRTRI